MRAFIPLIAVLLVSAQVLANDAEIVEHFEWPQEQAMVIPDLRLSSTITDARNEAKEARSRARDGWREAGRAKRREAVRRAVGLGAKPILVDNETVMTASPVRPRDMSYTLGSMAYPNGAHMLGGFGPDIGIFTGDPTSSLKEFRGWVYGAKTATPTPMTGVFEFKNGESFSGSYNTGSNAIGIYLSVDGSKQFVGVIDFHGASWIPLQGVLETKSGKVLAVIGTN